MNSIRQIQELNKRELENGVSPEASWHTDYRDTAYIYIGGLPFELTEGDVITIFSQFGEPTYINLIRDKETGKSRGFAFLKYEDQRSTDLAVDNLGGTVIKGRTLRVDHTRYKKKDDEPDEGHDLTMGPKSIVDDGEERRKRRRTSESDSEEERPMIREEIELAKLMEDQDDEDPMKAFLIQEKREEVALALAKVKDGKKSEKSHKHRHHHRSRRPKEADDIDGSRQSRHRKEGRENNRSHSRDMPPVGERAERSRPSKHDEARDNRSNSRRSPRREDRGRSDRDKGSDHRRRNDSHDRRRHHSRRDS